MPDESQNASSNPQDLWDEEIKERIKAYDEGRVQAIPYEEIRRKIEAALGRGLSDVAAGHVRPVKDIKSKIAGWICKR